MKFLSTQTFQCGITVQGSTTLGSTVYLTGLTNASTWDWIPVGSNTGNQLYYRTYAQIISDITAGIGLSGYVPTSRTLTINGTTYDLTANRSWTISASSVPKVQHQVKAGVAINKGQAVYVTSADGTNMIVGLASNASEATSSKTMGLLDATVSTNGFANVVTEGLLAGLDTSTAGTEGDPVWLGTGGNLIYGLINKPYAPAHLVFIGIVTRKNASNGEIFVKVQNGFELNEIHDVDLKTNLPTAGQLLRYESDGLWKNWSPNYLTAEADTLATVTGRGNVTSTPIRVESAATGLGGYMSVGNSNESAGNYSAYFFGNTASDANYFKGGIAYETIASTYGRGNIHFLQNSSTSGSIATLSDSVMTILNGGNVGIGTTSPSARLDVLGGIQAAIFRTSDASTFYTTYQVNTTTVLGYIGNGNGIVSGGGVNTFGVRSESDLIFAAGGNAERMRITSAGNIGIGTTSPGSLLQVGYQNTTTDALIRLGVSYDGSRSARGGITWHDGGNTTGKIYTEYDGTQVSMVFGSLYSAGYNSNQLMVIRGNGNVGIGTSSPSTKLTVDNSANASTNHIDMVGYNSTAKGHLGQFSNNIYLSTNYYYSGGQYNDTATLGQAAIVLSAGSTTTSFIDFNLSDAGANNPSSKVRIISNGNVGIGTTSPGYKLSVAASGNSYNVSPHSAGVDLYSTGNISPHYQTNYWWFTGVPGAGTFRMGLDASGNLGIGTSTPSQSLHVAGNIRVTGAFYDSNNQAGTSGQILKSTGSGTDWVSLSEITGVDGSGTANYVTKWSDADTIANSLIYDNGTNVGIGTTSPGYNFDVNGQVRVQDKLRVGNVNSGNGVVHMSSTATINPSATTIVWAQNVSVGMCAFIEYYILNNNSLTDQRAGTIMVTWNQSGTPTIAHTETTTPDIGSTIAVNFTSSLVGSDARINAVNSSANPYTIVMSYKYF